MGLFQDNTSSRRSPKFHRYPVKSSSLNRCNLLHRCALRTVVFIITTCSTSIKAVGQLQIGPVVHKHITSCSVCSLVWAVFLLTFDDHTYSMRVGHYVTTIWCNQYITFGLRPQILVFSTSKMLFYQFGELYEDVDRSLAFSREKSLNIWLHGNNLVVPHWGISY